MNDPLNKRNLPPKKFCSVVSLFLARRLLQLGLHVTANILQDIVSLLYLHLNAVLDQRFSSVLLVDVRQSFAKRSSQHNRFLG